MNPTSILFVIDGEEPVRRCLERALMFARALQARLDILLWRDWSSYASRLQPGAPEQGLTYLTALRNSLLCPGVEITTQACFGGSLAEILAEKIKQLHPLMVVKIRRHGLAWHGSSTDRELMQTCAVPLLLTDGSAWSKPPRFAAAVKVLREDAATDRDIIQTTAALQRAFAASVDIVYAQATDLLSEAPEGESPAQQLLRQLVHGCHVEPQCIHVLNGAANHVLPHFVAAMHYDLLAIGSPTERSHAFWHFSAPALADALIRTSCDLLVVNADHGDLLTELAGGERLICHHETAAAASHR